MNITVRTVGTEYHEVVFSEDSNKLQSGVLDRAEAIEMAQTLLQASSEILYGIDEMDMSDSCDSIVENLERT